MVNSGGRNYKEIDDIISNHCIHNSTAKQGKCQKAKVDEGSFFEDFLCFFCFGFGLSLLFVSFVSIVSGFGFDIGYFLFTVTNRLVAFCICLINGFDGRFIYHFTEFNVQSLSVLEIFYELDLLVPQL